MTDESSAQQDIQAIFPPPNLPAIFTDGPINLSHGGPIVRFYLARMDPSVNGVAATRPNPVAQVIMSFEGFIAMATFFNVSIQNMVKEGTLTQKQLDDINAAARAALGVNPDETSGQVD